MDRRSFLSGLIAAPAVVAIGSLMPIRGIIMPPAPTVARLCTMWEAGGWLYSDELADVLRLQVMLDAQRCEDFENSFPRATSIRLAAARQIEPLSAPDLATVWSPWPARMDG